MQEYNTLSSSLLRVFSDHFMLFLNFGNTVAYVSVLKRRTGEIVIAFANDIPNLQSVTFFWWPVGYNEGWRRELLPVRAIQSILGYCSHII